MNQLFPCRNYMQKLILFSLLCSLIIVPGSLAQTTTSYTCRSSYYEKDKASGEGTAEDKAIIEAFLPLSSPRPNCSFLKKTDGADTYYFVFYDYSDDIPNDDFRKLYLRALKRLSYGYGTIVSELATADIAEDDSADFYSEIIEFEVPNLREYLFAPTTTYNHLYNSSYFIAWDGLSLRPVGPDWRHNEELKDGWNLKRRAPITNPTITLCHPEALRDNYCATTIYSNISYASRTDYLIPSNIYEPWPLFRMYSLFNTTSLQQRENESNEIYSFSNLSSGNVKEVKIFSVPSPQAGGSFLVNIEYTDSAHIPQKVELTQGDKILYSGPSGVDTSTGKYRFRLNSVPSEEDVKYAVEGKIGDTATFSFERPNCDLNQDGYVDSRDMEIIRPAIGQSVPADDFRDFSGDGLVGEEDIKGCEQNCNIQGCDVSPLDVYVPPVGSSLSAIEVNQTSVEAGGSLVVTILMSRASSDEQVTLSSSNSVITLPSVITIPSGATNGQVTVIAGDIQSETVVSLTANYKGETKAVDVIVKPKPITLSSFSVSSNSVKSGSNLALSAVLSRSSTAPETVTLSSSDTSVPVSSLVIPAESNSGSTNITVGNVITDTNVTITASYNQTKLIAQVVVKPKTTIISKIINIIKSILTRLFG